MPPKKDTVTVTMSLLEARELAAAADKDFDAWAEILGSQARSRAAKRGLRKLNKEIKKTVKRIQIRNSRKGEEGGI